MSWICNRCGLDNLDESEECTACKEADKPFYRKTTKQEGEDKLLMTLRALLDEIKDVLDLSSDGAALKLAAFKGWGVLQRTLGRDFLKWLASKDRQSRGMK
jgi:hypothetical protein